MDSVSHLNGTSEVDGPKNERVSSNETNALQVLENRRAPEGKDNDSVNDREIMEGTKEKTYSTDVNGKVTVHVVVTINGNGTLADLKKQRMQIRNSNSDVSSLSSPVNTTPDGEPIPGAVNNTDIVRFTGETDEVVDYSKSKGCCTVQ